MTPAELMALPHITEDMAIDCLRQMWGPLSREDRETIARIILTALGYAVPPQLVDSEELNPFTDCEGRA